MHELEKVKEAVKKLMSEGKYPSTREVGKVLGISHTMVRKIVMKHGFKSWEEFLAYCREDTTVTDTVTDVFNTDEVLRKLESEIRKHAIDIYWRVYYSLLDEASKLLWKGHKLMDAIFVGLEFPRRVEEEAKKVSLPEDVKKLLEVASKVMTFLTGVDYGDMAEKAERWFRMKIFDIAYKRWEEEGREEFERVLAKTFEIAKTRPAKK
ncbi:MAG: hypothetical protein J7L51_03735 [Desulfurococcales archaeon]|nr:hypothetical protein [Desulfurococcales archaeon]